MDWFWPYVWATYRIADRGGRPGPKVGAALLELSKRSWSEGEPKHNQGFMAGNAWMTRRSLNTLKSVAQADKFLFAANKPLCTKLQEFADSPTAQRVRRKRSLADVFAENEADVEELKTHFSLTPRDLTYRGAVILGWGVPKGIFWIGVTTDPSLWSHLPEERALELYRPLRRFALRPQDPIPGQFQYPVPLLQYGDTSKSWRFVVARSLLATTGYDYPAGERTLVQRGDEFVLVFPSQDDVWRVRSRQLREQPYQLSVIDRDVVLDAVRYFPWLWANTTSRGSIITDNFGAVARFLIAILAFQNVGRSITLNSVIAYWEAHYADDWRSLLEQLITDGFLIAGATSVGEVHARMGREVFFAHSGVEGLLRSVSEWVLDKATTSALVSRVALMWKGRDNAFSLRAYRLAWLRYSDPVAHRFVVQSILAEGDVAAADDEVHAPKSSRRELCAAVFDALTTVLSRRHDPARAKAISASQYVTSAIASTL